MAISLTSSAPYTQNFDSLANTATSSTLPAEWLIAESGTGANTIYTAGTGSGNAGDTYSFGAASSTDRALGGLQSGSLIPSFGTSFTNNTGSTITALDIAYTGERWRVGTAGRTDRLDFQYSTDATSLATGTWTNVDALDFTSTVGTTVGLTDGNAAANRTNINSSISSLSLANGSTFWIRWNDFNATGADDGLAIDDFSLTPVVATVSAGITITQSGGNTSVTEGGASDSYQVSLNTQPTDDVTITLTNPGSPSQLAVTPTTLTFTPTNWNTAQSVSVTAVDDLLVEGLHNSVINHSVTSTDANYSTVSVPAVTVGIVDNDVTVTKIHDIQGSGSTFNTAFGGSQTIEGIVVGAFQGTTKLNGFYVQEEDADADTDAATSEGIFVFDPTGLFSGAVGSKVRLTGNVGEFTSTSTGIAGTANSSLTQISGITNVVNLGNVALPTVTNIVLPVTSTADLERYEGTLVNISAGANPLTVTETFKLGRFGQVGLSGNGRINQYTQSNAPSVSGYADYLSNLQDNYIILDDGSTGQNPDPTIHARGGQPLSASNTLRAGDSIASISGVLDERFEGFRVQTTTPANFLATNAREATAPAVGGNLKVASFNLLNFFNGNGIDANSDGLIDGGFPTARGANTATEFKRQLDKTVQAVLGLNPDIFGYNEIENDGYGANSAVQELVDSLNAVAGAGTYAFVNPPATALDASGRFGGDEITVGFIYKTSAARVAPGTNPAALTTGAFDQVTNRVQRPALAVTFERLANGTPTNETFTGVINHFKSKGSSAGGAGDADAGDGQGLSNGTRTRAAQELATWLATNPTGTSDTDYLITGDLNAYQSEDPVTTLTSAGYNNLFNSDSYSFQFNGQWGSLDHALASGSLNSQVTGAAKWHINSDEPTVLDYNTEFKTAGQVSSFYNVDPFRSSDHDPIVVGLNLQRSNSAPTGAPTTILPNTSEDTIITIASTDLLAGFSDVDGDGLTVVNLAANSGTLTNLGADSFSFAPDANFNGVVTLTYDVSDGITSLTNQTRSFNVAAVNDAPTGSPSAVLVGTNEDVALTINDSDLLVGFSDVDGDTLSVTNLAASNGQLVNNNNGTYSFTPTANYNGLVNLTYSVTDGSIDLAGQAQSFNVAAVNDAPIVQQSIADQSTGPNQLFTFTLPSNTFTDVDAGDVLNYSASLNDGLLPSWLTFDSVSRTFTGTPPLASIGNLDIRVTATDNSGASISDVFTLAVGKSIIGTFRADNLVGTNGNDRILGLYGRDTIVGGAGNDTISGGFDRDNMDGGDGFDIVDYEYWDFGGNYNLQTGTASFAGFYSEQILNFEGLLTGAGDDFVVGSNADNRIETGAGRDRVNGGLGNDTIYGGAGADQLIGGGGADNLFGGAGKDAFIFNNSNEGIDKINDFAVGSDQIEISRAGFGGSTVVGNAGVLRNTRFVVGASATTAGQRFIYNNTSGGLFFDSDGIGAIEKVQIAQLSENLSLTNRSFSIF
jgi:uncharacterized protein